MRAVFQWSLGQRTLELGKRTLIMGIVNVTPDSFSDGGLYLDSSQAINHALQLLDEGADMIDVGGESTRPGAKPTVSADEELRRVLPGDYGTQESASRRCDLHRHLQGQRRAGRGLGRSRDR
jgi:dihydropteroate synthase